jgi:hypothetical protein
MIKSVHISSVLSETAGRLSKQLNLQNHTRDHGLLLSLTSTDGNLLAASVGSDSPDYRVCQRISAVAASVALEYIAVEKLGGADFRTLTFSTDVRVVRCTRFFRTNRTTCLFLVVTLSTLCELDEISIMGLVRAVSDRIEEDLLPSVTPVLANMMQAPLVE